MTPSAVTWELVRSGHLVRSLRLAPVEAGAAAVVAFLVSRRGGTPDVLGDLRVVGLLLALGNGFVLDDGAAVTLQASPCSLARRLGLRIGSAAAVAVLLWTAVLAYLLPAARWPAIGGPRPRPHRRAGRRTRRRLGGRRLGPSPRVEHPGIVTTPALLAALFLAASVSRAPVLVGLGPQWAPAHARWAGIMIGAAGVLLGATRDPAARFHHRVRR